MKNLFCRPSVRSRYAFTMVEIALCLAIIGFALIAIIGVLPAGLNVQKDNREETIINQDATVWLDALRSGSFGFNELSRYVDRVVVSSQNFDINNNPVGGTIVTVAEQNLPAFGDNRIQFNDGGGLILGLLGTPRIGPPIPFNNPPAGAEYSTNYVYALVRAFSGSAAEKPPQDNLDVRDLGFNYRMVVENTTFGTFDPSLLHTNDVNVVLNRNLVDVRLLFRWPLKASYTPNLPLDETGTGPGRLVYRTELSGALDPVPNNNYPDVAFYFLRPRLYRAQ